MRNEALRQTAIEAMLAMLEERFLILVREGPCLLRMVADGRMLTSVISICNAPELW